MNIAIIIIKIIILYLYDESEDGRVTLRRENRVLVYDTQKMNSQGSIFYVRVNFNIC